SDDKGAKRGREIDRQLSTIQRDLAELKADLEPRLEQRKVAEPFLNGLAKWTEQSAARSTAEPKQREATINILAYQIYPLHHRDHANVETALKIEADERA